MAPLFAVLASGNRASQTVANKAPGVAWALALAALACCSHPVDPAAAQDKLPDTTLRKLAVQGRAMVTADPDRKPVALHGMVFTGGVWRYSRKNPDAASLPQVQFMQSEADVKRVGSWGANAIALYLNYYWFESPAGFEFMDQVLGWCRKANVYLIPSLTVYPHGGLRGGPAFFADSKARDQLAQFWIRFATRYRGRPEIAGYDILNEPQGASVEEVVAYQERLVDSIREADPDTIIFIEPVWGNPKDFRVIRRSNLVYNAHYYEPFYFTSQGWPWMYGGGVPTGLDYPDTKGETIKDIKPVNGEHGLCLPTVPAGTYDWQRVAVTQAVPGRAEYAYVKLFSNGDSRATLWFDQVEYSLNGAPYQLVPNGSFKEKNPVSDEPLLWEYWQAGKGSGSRTDAVAKEGKYSICIQNPSAWANYANYSEAGWCATRSAVPVTSGQTITVRFWVKARDATAQKNGLVLLFCRPDREVYTRREAIRDMQSLLVDFSARNQVPVFVGEFTPSLLGKRPDILDYIRDLAEYWNAHDISWTFYQYRDVGNWYLGIFNGPSGVPTEKCREDQELREVLRRLMK